MKKLPGDIIILHRCNINDNHMMYGSWDTKCDRGFFVILDYFYPFTTLTTQKIQILKKMKNLPGDIIILHKCTINDNHIRYGSWDMERDRQNFFVILDHFLHFYPPNNLKNQNFEKLKKKNTWRYHHFTLVYQKSLSYAILFLRCGA